MVSARGSRPSRSTLHRVARDLPRIPHFLRLESFAEVAGFTQLIPRLSSAFSLTPLRVQAGSPSVRKAGQRPEITRQAKFCNVGERPCQRGGRTSPDSSP